MLVIPVRQPNQLEVITNDIPNKDLPLHYLEDVYMVRAQQNVGGGIGALYTLAHMGGV